MVSSTAANSTALWPPDDTEESIVGVDRHQYDIITVRTGINEEAHRVAAGSVLPWQALSQVMLQGLHRRDGSPYTVLPDVFVYPRPIDRTRGSYALAQDGPPVLVVEVASESTYRADLDQERGKAWSYADAGVAEYLVLDPTGAFVPDGGRGWRLEGGVYRPWEPDDQGRWRSGQIGVAMGSEDGLAAVYGADGKRGLREGELNPRLEAARAEGRVEGLAEGKRSALRQLVRARFGAAAALDQRIDAATESEIDTLFTRILSAPTFAALWS